MVSLNRNDADAHGHALWRRRLQDDAYELFQQLGGRMPGRVVVPVAVGDILYGPWKGFRELHALGAGGELPRMHARAKTIMA